MTPTEELRMAAAKLRVLAGKATASPWTTRWNAQEYELVGPDRPYPIAEWTYAVATWEPKASEQRAECDTGDADYIAAMHPLVGLDLADWLESAAEDAVQIGPDPHAVAVARQLLGSQP
ncbi:hypothetical protein [Streptomyces sp. NPDC001658]